MQTFNYFLSFNCLNMICDGVNTSSCIYYSLCFSHITKIVEHIVRVEFLDAILDLCYYLILLLRYICLGLSKQICCY